MYCGNFSSNSGYIGSLWALVGSFDSRLKSPKKKNPQTLIEVRKIDKGGSDSLSWKKNSRRHCKSIKCHMDFSRGHWQWQLTIELGTGGRPCFRANCCKLATAPLQSSWSGFKTDAPALDEVLFKKFSSSVNLMIASVPQQLCCLFHVSTISITSFMLICC